MRRKPCPRCIAAAAREIGRLRQDAEWGVDGGLRSIADAADLVRAGLVLVREGKPRSARALATTLVLLADLVGDLVERGRE